jgi:hypothetical protein
VNDLDTISTLEFQMVVSSGIDDDMYHSVYLMEQLYLINTICNKIG